MGHTQTYQHFETVPIFPLVTCSLDSSSWFPCYLKAVLLSQVKTRGRLIFSFEKKTLCLAALVEVNDHSRTSTAPSCLFRVVM